MTGEHQPKPQSFHISVVRKDQDVRPELEKTTTRIQEIKGFSQIPRIVSDP